MIILSILSGYRKEYWDRVKPCWNHGWILETLKLTFWVLSWLSIGVIVPYCIENKRGFGCRDLFVDSYVFIWVMLSGVVFTFFAINDAPWLAHNCVVLGFFSYRLFETFQSWFSQYILGGVPKQWETRHPYRSLVLVFVGYAEVIFIYALLAFILQNNFYGIVSWQQAFRYSLGNAITIGSSGIVPTLGVGYALFATQIMFTLLFLTSAVNRIYTAIRKP